MKQGCDKRIYFHLKIIAKKGFVCTNDIQKYIAILLKTGKNVFNIMMTLEKLLPSQILATKLSM